MKKPRKLKADEVKLLRFNLNILLAQADLEMPREIDKKKNPLVPKANLPMFKKNAA